MKEKDLKALVGKIVNWAKEKGKEYPQDIVMRRVRNEDGSESFMHFYPEEMNKFINKTENEIMNLDNSDLRRLEDALVHIPDERAFQQSQVIALNLIRSIVFLEVDTRRNKPPIEPGE